MKKILKITALILLLILVLSAVTACGSGVVEGEAYYLYVYDTGSDRFIQTQTSLTFGEDFKTFEYTFIDGELTVMGTVEHSETPDAYTISCNEESVAVVSSRYKAALIASGASASVIEMYESLGDAFTPRAQYYVYEDKLFKGDAVELYHEPDGDCDSFEGVYRLSSSDEKIRLRGGVMYGADDKGEFTVKKGYYSVSRGIMTVTSTNEDGSDRYVNGVLYRKRYLMAKMTLSDKGDLLGTDLEEQLETSDFIGRINSQISEYSGKTIAVLAEQFLARDL